MVEADRLPDAQLAAPFSIHVLDAEELRRAPQFWLDDILRAQVLRAQVPEFNLFRRNSSRTANPTTQVMTLRNFGPSGAKGPWVSLGLPCRHDGPTPDFAVWAEQMEAPRLFAM